MIEDRLDGIEECPKCKSKKFRIEYTTYAFGDKEKNEFWNLWLSLDTLDRQEMLKDLYPMFEGIFKLVDSKETKDVKLHAFSSLLNSYLEDLEREIENGKK